MTGKLLLVALLGIAAGGFVVGLPSGQLVTSTRGELEATRGELQECERTRPAEPPLLNLDGWPAEVLAGRLVAGLKELSTALDEVAEDARALSGYVKADRDRARSRSSREP